MKSLIRWSATLGILGSTFLGTCLQALALPVEQVVQKLQPVPVFTITDAKGAPLVASVNQSDKKGSVAGVFISQKDAQAFVERLKKENPQLGGTVKVVPISLGDIYKLQQSNKNKPDSLNFAYVPVQQQVQSAMAILRQTDPKAQQFPGVPLFVARAGEDKGYLTVQQGNQQLIPFFFDKEQLQKMVERFKQQQPKVASTIQIQAVPLENMLETFSSSTNQQLNNVILVPSTESMEFLRTIQQKPANNTQQPPKR